MLFSKIGRVAERSLPASNACGILAIRNRLGKRAAKRVTNREIMEALCLISDVQKKQVEAIALLGDRITTFEQRVQKGLEGLEENGMAMLESLDRWGTMLTDLIGEQRMLTPPDNDSVTEAQVKREWFGEDDPV